MKPGPVAGVDEAGRGPLAGPVVVAAVMLDPRRPIDGLADSKKLSERQRNELFSLIRENALSWSVVSIDVQDIDRLNILQATLLGMRRSILELDPAPSLALIDGNRAPDLPCPARTIVQGDRLEPAISAASILAKVTRDRVMVAMHEQFPGYGFAQHKGYPTALHLERLGACAIHRRSFAPVHKAAQKALL